jgi:hypothetical protein
VNRGRIRRDESLERVDVAGQHAHVQRREPLGIPAARQPAPRRGPGAGKERVHRRRVARDRGRDVEGVPSVGVSPERVRLVVEQELDDVGARPRQRQVQRRAAFGAAHVHLGPQHQQGPHELRVPAERREVQEHEALAVLGAVEHRLALAFQPLQHLPHVHEVVGLDGR